MLSKYEVEIRDQYGHLVTVLQRPMNRQFSVYRNRPGSCQFTLDLFDSQATPNILRLNQYDIVFRRDGNPVFAGQISYIEPKVDQDNKTVDVIATGYLDLLDYRHITIDYPNYDFGHNDVAFDTVDSGAVFSTLIDYTQFPITYDDMATLGSTSISLNQSFISAGTGTISKLRLLLDKNSATGNITVALYTENGDIPVTYTLVANSSLTVAASTISTNLAWYDFTYITPPTLTAGTKYWIKLTTDTTQSGSNGVQWAYLNDNYYLNGIAYSPEDTDLFSSDQDLQFFVLLSDNSYQQTKNCYLGLNEGTIQTSFNISPVYSQYKKIKGCLDDISKNLNGVDFNFTVSINPITNIMTKYYNVFYPRQGTDQTTLNFSYPGNIKKINKPKDGKAMNNEIVARGQGYGTIQTIQVVDDPASIMAYGLRQDVNEEADVPDTGTLFTLASEYLRLHKDPLDLPTIYVDGNIPPFIGSYGIGDQIFVNITGAPILDFLQIYRIEQIDTTISDDDQEEIMLSLSIV